LDTLVSIGILQRDGIKETAIYRNSKEASTFLNKNNPKYIGGFLTMLDVRVYPFLELLENGLRTGLPQNEKKTI